MELIEKNKDKFQLYYEFLIEENSKYNLTSIIEKDEIYIKHFYDSLAMKKLLDLNEIKSICDVGSGAGFPAIPLKICFPYLEITIIEPTLKRVNFLKMLVEKIKLDNIRIINARAEDIANEYIEKFDVCTARAVSSMPILLELLVSYAKVGGHIVLYKGNKGIEELTEAKKALSILNCNINKIYDYELPGDYGKRILIDIIKNKCTDKKYPRRYAEIKKKPL